MPKISLVFSNKLHRPSVTDLKSSRKNLGPWFRNHIKKKSILWPKAKFSERSVVRYCRDLRIRLKKDPRVSSYHSYVALSGLLLRRGNKSGKQ